MHVYMQVSSIEMNGAYFQVCVGLQLHTHFGSLQPGQEMGW